MSDAQNGTLVAELRPAILIKTELQPVFNVKVKLACEDALVATVSEYIDEEQAEAESDNAS